MNILLQIYIHVVLQLYVHLHMYRLVRHTNICTSGFTNVCTLTYVQVGKAHKYMYIWFYNCMYTYICTGWYGTQIYVHVVLH